MALGRKTHRKSPFTKGEVAGLIRRFVKEHTDSGPTSWRAQTILFYQLYSKYPDEAFWRAYEPGFMLNSLAYFLTPDGATKLAQDIALFHLDFGPEPDYHMSDEKQGSDIMVEKKPRSMADLLK